MKASQVPCLSIQFQTKNTRFEKAAILLQTSSPQINRKCAFIKQKGEFVLVLNLCKYCNTTACP